MFLEYSQRENLDPSEAGHLPSRWEKEKKKSENEDEIIVIKKAPSSSR